MNKTLKNQTTNVHAGHRERLRTKFTSGTLLDHELLELLLCYSIPRKDTNEIAHNLLNAFGSLSNLFKQDVSSLKRVDGVGENTAFLISIIGKLYASKEVENVKKLKLSSIAEAKTTLAKLFKNADHEIFYCLYLNGKDSVIGFSKMDSFKENSVTIDFGDLIKGVLAYKPASVIIAHNHFALYPKPSKEDDLTTAKIYLLLQLNQVNLYDHLIFSGDQIYSYFYDNKLNTIKQSVIEKLSNKE